MRPLPRLAAAAALLAAGALASGLGAPAAFAQERGNAILVLDASGSMWGQIDGTPKISIAREVLGGLLSGLPEEQVLGLTAYGHRTRGDCGDIETLVAPGAGSRDAIAEAVAAINPRGSTPLSAAVIAAAEALRYTEEAATVILISDGIETCDLDPCAVGAELEAAGIDFTAHVIGFDVDDVEARAQLQCLAENTGGTFRTAANAAELTEALAVVAEPAPAEVTFRAVEGSEDGAVLDEPLVWEVFRDGAAATDILQGATATAALAPGAGYRVEALRPSDEAVAGAEFGVAGPATVTVVFPVALPAATLEAPGSAPIGATVDVAWTGPDERNDYVSVAVPGETGYENYGYTRKGSPARVEMPVEPGSYELRYIRADGRQVLATRPIEVTPLTVTLDAPDSAPLGATIAVGHDGPGYRNDYIDVAREGERYINYGYTRNGPPVEVVMPPEPGRYVLRYVLAQGSTPIAVRPIEVTPVEASLDAPAAAVAGSELTVGWIGPDYRNDYIAISRPDDPRYETYTYTREGAPLEVTVPLEPGDYELRYVMAQDSTVLARVALRVDAVGATLEAVDSARAGAPVVVHWDGPGYDRDYISVARPDDPRYEGFTYTREGSPLILRLPAEPGTYELRYIAASDGESILARRIIEAVPVTATLAVEGDARAGAPIAVSWEGPDYRDDYISIGRVGQDDYISYRYTREDSPMVLELPQAPGDYELRYQLGQGDRIIARLPLAVE